MFQALVWSVLVAGTKFNDNILCLSDTTAPTIAPALLDWSTVHVMMPWSIILLLGGGFALADGCKVDSLALC